MTAHRYLLPLLVLPLNQACSRPDSHSANLASLIGTERAFSAMSAASGTRAASLEFLSDSGIVFDAVPTNGKELWRGRPESESLLSWRPVYADVSASGDLGYTTGPWEWSENSDSAPARWGHYVTVWQENPDGSWKFAIDGGIVHRRPASSDTTVASPPIGKGSRNGQTGTANTISERIVLLRLDRDYSRLAADSGVALALESFTASDVRVYRDSVFPILGHQAGSTFISMGGYNHVVWEPIAAVVSASGDLGVTYGVATEQVPNQADPTRSSNFLHIWRREPQSGWRVAVDLLTPSPPVRDLGN